MLWLAGLRPASTNLSHTSVLSVRAATVQAACRLGPEGCFLETRRPLVACA